MAALHERRGERVQAASYFARFIELWKDCDPELQHVVDDARARLTALQRAAS